MKTTIVASVFALAALTTTTPVELESRDDSLPDNTFGRLDVYSTPECTNSELLGDQGKDIFVPRNICTPTLITEVDALGVKVEVATMSYRAHLFFGDDQGHLGGGCAFFLFYKDNCEAQGEDDAERYIPDVYRNSLTECNGVKPSSSSLGFRSTLLFCQEDDF